MSAKITKLQKLLDEGSKFTFENFSTKSSAGYPQTLTGEWATWTVRVDGAVRNLFAAKSAQVLMLDRANAVVVLGNGPDKFRLALSLYIGALKATLDTLEDDTFDEVLGAKSAAVPAKPNATASSNKVFIVHGHDEQAKTELEVLLTEMGLQPVVLHRQADGGQTLIEKFEKHADVGYAFILLTPDEIAYVVSEEAKADGDRKKEYRARPNVIFEFGYFVGRLGRARTCCLYRSPVVVPSDLSGLIYKPFNKSIEEVAYAITKELKALGYKLP